MKTRQREKLNNNEHPMRPQPTSAELRTDDCPSGLSGIWSEWLGLLSPTCLGHWIRAAPGRVALGKKALHK